MKILIINDLNDYTMYALLGKWILVLSSFTFIMITLKNILKNKKNIKAESTQEPIKSLKSTFEDEILKKDTLKTKSELMMEDLLSKK